MFNVSAVHYERDLISRERLRLRKTETNQPFVNIAWDKSLLASFVFFLLWTNKTRKLTVLAFPIIELNHMLLNYAAIKRTSCNYCSAWMLTRAIHMYCTVSKMYVVRKWEWKLYLNLSEPFKKISQQRAVWEPLLIAQFIKWTKYCEKEQK